LHVSRRERAKLCQHFNEACHSHLVRPQQASGADKAEKSHALSRSFHSLTTANIYCGKFFFAFVDANRQTRKWPETHTHVRISLDKTKKHGTGAVVQMEKGQFTSCKRKFIALGGGDDDKSASN
jgi:hypothetical protein